MPLSPKARAYAVIYADPPWSFATYSRKGKGRSPDAHYDVMSLDQIKALPVASWAAKDCVLLMWATDPLLEQAFAVIEAWGFTYKTVGFYWAKLKRDVAPAGPPLFYNESSFFTGMGFWTRANPEPCLLATRGRPKRRGADVRKLVIAPRREHSRKPEAVYERIEALCAGPYLELFGRASRPGWDTWGLQTGLFDDGPAATRRWRSDRYPDAPEPAE